MRLLKLLGGTLGVIALTAGSIWAFAEPTPEPITTALLPACGAGKCMTAGCATEACTATKSACQSGTCPAGTAANEIDPLAVVRDLRNWDSIAVAHTESNGKAEDACAATSSCQTAKCDGECCQSGDCKSACCTKDVSASNCSKCGESCDKETIPVTVIDAACSEGDCRAESQASCCQEGCDRKPVSTEVCSDCDGTCDKNCDKGTCQHHQHKTISAATGELLIGAPVSAYRGEECREKQYGDGECHKGGSCEKATVTTRLREVKPAVGSTAHVHVTITVAHSPGKTFATSGACDAACPAPPQPVVAQLPKHADYLSDKPHGAGVAFTESFWRAIAERSSFTPTARWHAETHEADCPHGVCPRAALGPHVHFPPAEAPRTMVRHPGPGVVCPLCRLASFPAMGPPPVAAYFPRFVAGPCPAPMAPVFNSGFPHPIAPPVAAAPPVPVAPPHVGRPQVSARPLSMLGPRTVYHRHNWADAPRLAIQKVSFDGNKFASGPQPAHRPTPQRHAGDPAILGSWVRETDNSTVHITCEHSRIQGTANLTLDEFEMTIHFSGTCSVTPDGQLFGVIDHVDMESSDPDADAALGTIATRMIDQPFALHFRGNDDALFVKDVKCAGTAWLKDTETVPRPLNVCGCGKYVPDSE